MARSSGSHPPTHPSTSHPSCLCSEASGGGPLAKLSAAKIQTASNSKTRRKPVWRSRWQPAMSPGCPLEAGATRMLGWAGTAASHCAGWECGCPCFSLGLPAGLSQGRLSPGALTVLLVTLQAGQVGDDFKTPHEATSLVHKFLSQSINRQERGARRQEYRPSINGHCGTPATAGCEEPSRKSKAPCWEKILK